MNKTVLLCAVLAGCAGTPAPCPEGQARTNAGQCVAIAAPPTQSLADFDPFPQQAPAKDEYIAGGGTVLSDESIARINAENARHAAEADAEYARRRAERKADERTDRIVEAQRDTQRELQALRDGVNR